LYSIAAPARRLDTFIDMSGAEIGLVVSVFLACAVEAVEALTIVMAVGQTRDWSSSLSGAAAATVALAAAVAILGGALAHVSIEVLRVVVGVFLLVLGLQWLRKAVLRAAGLKAMHDELDIYEHERDAALHVSRARGSWDAYSFSVAFKGVLIEGLEVAIIVITFGANQHRVGLAAAAAGVAVLLVIAAGIAVRAPLARVPENTMKFAVGVMLCSFGIFWAGEGLGLDWPGGDASLLAIVPALAAASLATAASLRRTATR
jgi:uncharacterized membrane protein